MDRVVNPPKYKNLALKGKFCRN